MRELLEKYEERGIADYNHDETPDHHERVSFIRGLIDKYYQGGLCLDVGSAHSPFKDKFDEHIGLDWAFTKPYEGGVKADWTKMPFKDHSFDFIIWSEGPEHAVNPEETFREITRVSKFGAIIIVSCPREEEEPLGEFHLKSYSLDSLASLVGEFFDVIEGHEVFAHPQIAIAGSRVNYDWLVVVGGKA